MKKVVYFGVAILIAFMFSSCGSSKKVVKDYTEVKSSDLVQKKKIETPLSDAKYRSDKEYFRITFSGTSPRIDFAKKVALQNAKSELAGLVNTRVKKVMQNFSNQYDKSGTQDFENKVTDLATNAVKQQLSDISIIGEDTYEIKKGTELSYESWIAIEVSKQSVLNAIENGISNYQKLQIDYDKKKFLEDTYNKEMEEFGKAQ